MTQVPISLQRKYSMYAIFVVFMLCLSVRVYYTYEKQVMHVDESLSVLLAAYNDSGWTKIYEQGAILSGYELKRMAYWNDSSIKDCLEDIYNLRIDTRDSSHTNLYYSMLRLWFCGIDTVNMHEIIVQSCFLNILFFCCSFVLLYILASRVFQNYISVPFCLFVAFLNPASIANTLFIRPYQLQELLLIAATLVFEYYYSSKQYKFSACTFLGSAVILALVLLSGYFALFYVGLLGLFLLYRAYTDENKSICYFICLFLLSLVLTYVFYLKYFDGFLVGRGEEALSKFNPENMLENFVISAKALIHILGNAFLPFVLFVLCVGACVLCLVRKQFSKKTSLIIGVVGIVWCFIVMFFAPYKTLRYVMPAIPLLAIGLTFIFDSVQYKKAFAIFFIVFFIPQLFIKKIENVSSITPHLVESKLSIFVGTSPWKIASITPYVKDASKYVFYPSCAEMQKEITDYADSAIYIEDTSEEKCLELTGKLEQAEKIWYFQSYTSTMQNTKK